MFRKKTTSKEIDYEKLNEGINTGTILLKIFLVLSIVLLVFVVSKLLNDWKVIPFITNLLSIISPFFVGLVIAWLFDPIVKKLTNKGLKRSHATIIVYILFILFIYLLIRLMIPSVSEQLNDLIKSVPSFINYLKETIDDIFLNLTEKSGYDLTDIKIGLFKTVNNLGNSLTVDLPTTIVNLATSIIRGGTNLLLGLLVGFYMLFDFNNVKGHLINLIPKNHRKTSIELMDKLNNTLKSYVQGTLKIMFILFVFQSVALAIAGLKAPMVFGLFCAVTNVIPYVGPYIGGIPAVIVGLSISPITGLCTLIAVVIAQILESYFLLPLVIGKTMKLHPVTIMIGLLVFGNYFGIIGMLLATPIISTLKTIFIFLDEKYSIMEKIAN